MTLEDRAAVAARHAQECLELATRQAAEVLAFEVECGDTNSVTVHDGTPADSLRRVVEFLRYYKGINHLIATTNGDQVAHLLRSDLSNVVRMALGGLQVEPYPDSKDEGTLYLSRRHAALLAELMRTYFPAEFDGPATTMFVNSLRRSLITFSGR